MSRAREIEVDWEQAKKMKLDWTKAKAAPRRSRKTKFGDMWVLRQNPSVVVTVVEFRAAKRSTVVVVYFESGARNPKQMSADDFDDRYMPLSERDRDWYKQEA